MSMSADQLILTSSLEHEAGLSRTHLAQAGEITLEKVGKTALVTSW
jgi:hypothetical protein